MTSDELWADFDAACWDKLLTQHSPEYQARCEEFMAFFRYWLLGEDDDE